MDMPYIDRAIAERQAETYGTTRRVYIIKGEIDRDDYSVGLCVGTPAEIKTILEEANKDDYDMRQPFHVVASRALPEPEKVVQELRARYFPAESTVDLGARGVWLGTDAQGCTDVERALSDVGRAGTVHSLQTALERKRQERS